MKRLPKAIKQELGSLLDQMEKNLFQSRVYDPLPENKFLKTIEELKKDYDIRKYLGRYEKLREEKEKLEKLWLEER